jgi:hypothetical protein
MTNATVSKLSEYAAYVENLPEGFTLSRGQSGDYPLLPSALRHDDKGNRKYSKKSIQNFLNEFKINSHQYMENPWDFEYNIEWMLYAQHYGVPTRLLDFSSSHIVSILFAVEKAFELEEGRDAVVYFLNPSELNLMNIDTRAILDTKDANQKNNSGHQAPFVFQTRKINPRINAQRGAFVLFQDDDKPLESLDVEKVLKKITVPKDSIKAILVSLNSMGIDFKHIYPDLSSVAKDIILQKEIDDYVKAGA